MYVGFVLVVMFFLPFWGLIGGDAAYAAEPIKLKVLSSGMPEYLYVKDRLVPYIQRINQRSGGHLQISWVALKEYLPSSDWRH